MGGAAKPQRELVLFYSQEAFSSPQPLQASGLTLPSFTHRGQAGGLGGGTPGFYSWPPLPKAIAQPSHHLPGAPPGYTQALPMLMCPLPAPRWLGMLTQLTSAFLLLSPAPSPTLICSVGAEALCILMKSWLHAHPILLTPLPIF